MAKPGTLESAADIACPHEITTASSFLLPDNLKIDLRSQHIIATAD
jgi:hypothetical protein